MTDLPHDPLLERARQFEREWAAKFGMTVDELRAEEYVVAHCCAEDHVCGGFQMIPRRAAEVLETHIYLPEDRDNS